MDSQFPVNRLSKAKNMSNHTKRMTDSIAMNWRALSGQDHWEDLVDPLNLDLRRYILHYGERAEATYDTFNFEYKSKYAGSSIYVKDDLFASVGLERGNPFKYKAIKYFYATSTLPVPDAFILRSLSREAWSRESNFMGYIAVATDEGVTALGRRDILVAWRGTVQALEWFQDINFIPASGDELFGAAADVKIEGGWYSIYTSADPKSPFNVTSARSQVLNEIQNLLEMYKDEEVSVTVTGHSLGAAMAVLNAVDIAANAFKGQIRKCLVTAFVFGCPLVGDAKFRSFFDSIDNIRVLRVHNVTDIVPLWPLIGYAEVGEELLIDTRKSPYLKQPGIGFESRHNLEAAYLHGVAGTQGLGGGFKLEVNRPIALVNKFSNFLKEEYLVPNHWWNLRNKGMLQNDDGSWCLEDSGRTDNGVADDDDIGLACFSVDSGECVQEPLA